MSELYVVIIRANVYLSQRTPGREVKLPMKQLMSTQRCLFVGFSSTPFLEKEGFQWEEESPPTKYTNI